MLLGVVCAEISMVHNFIFGNEQASSWEQGGEMRIKGATLKREHKAATKHFLHTKNENR